MIWTVRSVIAMALWVAAGLLTILTLIPFIAKLDS